MRENLTIVKRGEKTVKYLNKYTVTVESEEMKVVASKKKRNSSRQLLNKKKKKERKVKEPLKDKYLEKLIKNAHEGREKRVILILSETGMHPEVMENPEEAEMEIDKGRLMWYRPKTHALCIWEFEEEGYIDKNIVEEFIKNDLGYDRTTYWRDIKKVANRSGLKYISPLTLRHTATIRRLNRGEKPDYVLKVIRCSPEVVWNHYANIMGIEVDRETEEYDRPK